MLRSRDLEQQNQGDETNGQDNDKEKSQALQPFYEYVNHTLEQTAVFNEISRLYDKTEIIENDLREIYKFIKR